MTTFNWTDMWVLDSSAVDEVYYNDNTQELAVDLHDTVYVYSGVPRSAYEDLVYAASVGRAFQQIKRTYGPGDKLGYCADVTYKHVGRSSEGNSTTAPTITVTNVTSSVPLTVDSGLRTFPLAAPAVESEDSVDVGRKMTVFFTNADGNDFEYNLTANSVDEAANVVTELGDVLGLTLTVTGVFVNFE